MRNSIKNWVYFLFSIVLLNVINCTKVPNPLEGWGDKVTITTGEFVTPLPTSTTINNSTITCRVSPLSGKERGICWSDSSTAVNVSANKIASGNGTGTFNTNLTNLLPAKTYYYRAYVLIASPSAALYGEVKSFTTPASCPSLTTAATTSVTYTTATSGGTVTSDGGAAVTVRGIVISSTNTTPSLDSGTVFRSGAGTGSFSVQLNSLNPGTLYYVRAFATNSAGTCYGNVVQFTTLKVTCPPVTSSSATMVGSTTANVGGDVTADGGATVTSRGIVISSSNSTPTIGAGTSIASGSGVGPFTLNLTNLTPGVTYYYRAYAINSAGTCYGTVLQFTTSAICPIVTTTSASSVGSTTAVTGGNVTNDGGSVVTTRGIVISSTNTTPAIGAGTTLSSGSGTGSFSISITNLQPGTTYYVRAFATNSVNTCYGSVIQFTTNSICPSVTTTSASAVGTTTATIGGNVTSDGGSTVTARGIVVSATNTSPSLGSGTTYSSGAGLGTFSTNLVGLSPGTTYYVRAYATNSAGTCYGSVVQFNTNSVCATLTTSNTSNISFTTATSGGNITDDGGASITARGVVISSSNSTPVIGSGTSYPSGTGTGAFVVNLINLSPATTYYARAYAINSAGTCYGNVTQFTTRTVLCPTISTAAVSSINQNSAIVGGNVSSDGGAPVTTRGVVISTSNNTPTLATGVNYASGSGTGSFTVNLANLTAATTYYVRAYATNSAGTCYGNVVQFNTTSISCPTLSTSSASNISSNAATVGGNITNNGGASITTRGVVFSSTNTTPTISNSTNVQSTSGSSVFSVTLSNLSRTTTYYARAYATNSAGTCYGNVITFTTPAQCPTVTTRSLQRLSSTSGTLGGSVTSDGGSNVTSRGVEITIGGSTPNTFELGSGTGVFSNTFTGFRSGTSYSVRAYATNSAGTCYGSFITFVW